MTAAGVSCSPPPFPNLVKVNRVALKEKGNDKRATYTQGEWSEKERVLFWVWRGMRSVRARSQTKPPTGTSP